MKLKLVEDGEQLKMMQLIEEKKVLERELKKSQDKYVTIQNEHEACENILSKMKESSLQQNIKMKGEADDVRLQIKLLHIFCFTFYLHAIFRHAENCQY